MRSRTSASVRRLLGQTSSFFVLIWTRSPDFVSSFGILVVFQPSLRDGFILLLYPALKRRAIFCRPSGAGSNFCPTFPRLAPWAALFRRFAAGVALPTKN